ncbi:hypothetical protein D9757_003029 [Collybiopsis confluens]|uniref:Protein kinase domain-containing protein n=1 Tax=Collybiopsis confluens TaxID=2823264 RepID=A0A8H5HXA9_9AGAR|nr:hypothetical protein D9757_003029 [Collybiopsis confluens]
MATVSSPSPGFAFLRSTKGRPSIQSSVRHKPKTIIQDITQTFSTKVTDEPIPSTSRAALEVPQTFAATKERKPKRKDKYSRPLPPTPPPSESILSPESNFDWRFFKASLLYKTFDNESLSSSSPTISSPTFSSAPYADRPAKKKYRPHLIYSRLHKLAEREISKAVNRGINVDREVLDNLSEIQVGAVNAVVQSRKYRDKLSEILSSLAGPEITSETRVYEAITSDEPQVANLIRVIVYSEDEKASALELKEKDAELFMDALEDVMSGFSESELLESRRLLIKLSKNSTNLPAYMFIDGVASVKDKNSFGGTFGDVYKSTYRNKPVALKRLRNFQQAESHRIYREALIWQRLSHKFILPFLGIDAENFPRSPCMVSPWMPGGTVNQFLKRNPRINIDKMLFEIAQGIDHLHLQDICHGDIKGGNILIDENGQPKLADFGLTTVTDATLHNTTDQGGTLRWMAPELLYPLPGIESYKRTTASDIYAYGCLCIELYTGRVPFANVRTEYLVLEKVHKGERPERPSGGNTMTDELWNLINWCWHQDRAARPRIGLVVDHLKHILRRSATDPAASMAAPLPRVQSNTSLATVGNFSLFGQTLTPQGLPTRIIPSEEEAALMRCLKRVRCHADPSRLYHELKLKSSNYSSSSPVKNYVARIKDTNSSVAVKQLKISHLDSFTLRLLTDEFSNMRFLHHPNIINYIDLFQHENYIWVVLEDLSNPLYLKKVIVANLNRDHGMKEAFITTVLRNVVHAVHYLHRHRISHGNINAEQVLLSYAGHSILVRLKLAAMIKDPDTYPRARRRPPNGDKEAQLTTDIWDLGLLAIEMFDSAMSLDLESPQLIDDFATMDPPPSPSLLGFVKWTMRDSPSERPLITALVQMPFLKK